MHGCVCYMYIMDCVLTRWLYHLDKPFKGIEITQRLRKVSIILCFNYLSLLRIQLYQLKHVYYEIEYLVGNPLEAV